MADFCMECGQGLFHVVKLCDGCEAKERNQLPHKRSDAVSEDPAQLCLFSDSAEEHRR